MQYGRNEEAKLDKLTSLCGGGGGGVGGAYYNAEAVLWVRLTNQWTGSLTCRLIGNSLTCLESNPIFFLIEINLARR